MRSLVFGKEHIKILDEVLNPATEPSQLSRILVLSSMRPTAEGIPILNKDMEDVAVRMINKSWSDYYSEECIRGAFDTFSGCKVKFKKFVTDGFDPALFATINPNSEPSSIMFQSENAAWCRESICDVFWEYSQIVSDDVLESVEPKSPIVSMISRSANRCLKPSMQIKIDALVNSDFSRMAATKIVGDIFKKSVAHYLSTCGVAVAERLGDVLLGTEDFHSSGMPASVGPETFNNPYANSLYRQLHNSVSIMRNVDAFSCYQIIEDAFFIFMSKKSAVESFAYLIGMIRHVSNDIGDVEFKNPLHRIF